MQDSTMGSNFRVSVASSMDDNPGDAQPVFVSNLQPKSDSPWSQIPIFSLQYIFKESSGQVYPNTPLCITYFDYADEITVAEEAEMGVSGEQKLDALLVGTIFTFKFLNHNFPREFLNRFVSKRRNYYN